MEYPLCIQLAAVRICKIRYLCAFMLAVCDILHFGHKWRWCAVVAGHRNLPLGSLMVNRFKSATAFHVIITSYFATQRMRLNVTET